MNRARNTDHAARTCQRFGLFYSQNNKIVWLSNMAEHFWRNSRGAQRFVGFYYLSVRFRCWLAERQTPITWRAGWKYCILLPYAEKQPTRDTIWTDILFIQTSLVKFLTNLHQCHSTNQYVYVVKSHPSLTTTTTTFPCNEKSWKKFIKDFIWRIQLHCLHCYCYCYQIYFNLKTLHMRRQIKSFTDNHIFDGIGKIEDTKNNKEIYAKCSMKKADIKGSTSSVHRIWKCETNCLAAKRGWITYMST